jgi:hypothetical protein
MPQISMMSYGGRGGEIFTIAALGRADTKHVQSAAQQRSYGAQ